MYVAMWYLGGALKSLVVHFGRSHLDCEM